MSEHIIHIDPVESDLIRFINGECTVEESERIYTRINDSAEVKESYLALTDSLGKYDRYELQKEFDVLKAKEKFFKQVGARRTVEAGKTEPGIKMVTWKKVAATIVIILLPALYFLFDVQNEALLTGIDQVSRQSLPDQSEVWLNKNSELSYHKGVFNNKRELTLTGEAYFEVVHNPERPFIIHSPGAVVKVVGTAFNIFDYPADSAATISVTKGVVEVYNNRGNLLHTLHAGRQITLNKFTGAFHVSAYSNENFQSWKTGTLQFNNAYLKDAIPAISKHFDIPILLEDSLEMKQINSTFTNNNLESVLEILSIMCHISVEKKDSIIYLTKKDN